MCDSGRPTVADRLDREADAGPALTRARLPLPHAAISHGTTGALAMSPEPVGRDKIEGLIMTHRRPPRKIRKE